MSRSQSTAVYNQGKSTATQDQGNAQSSYGATQGDISDYKDQLAKFASSNPYTKGGEYDSTIKTGLANTSDAGSQSLAGNLQSQALRTGQNSAADAATAAEFARQNERQLSSDDATAEQNRIGSEASYNQQALQDASVPISAESSLYGTSTGAGNTALNTAAGAAQQPSFWDQMGNAFVASTNGAGGAAIKQWG